MKQLIHSLKQHTSVILQITFGLFFVGIGLYFLRHEQAELEKVGEALRSADPSWVILGLILLVAFVVVQGLMYKVSFAAIHQSIRLSTGMMLYLKRNLVSVFLPAGVLTNMLFFNKEMKKKEGVNKTQIYFASSIFPLCSILSAVIVGLPALLWLFFAA